MAYSGDLYCSFSPFADSIGGFFGGIIDFLSQLHPKVAIPVTVIITVTLFFLAATTTFPTLQKIPTLYFTSRNHLHNYPTYSHCPYKSPQSHTFRLSGQHYNQCDKATNKDQAREREEREREIERREVWLNGSKRSH